MKPTTQKSMQTSGVQGPSPHGFGADHGLGGGTEGTVPGAKRETFVGEAITPADASFAVSAMATGAPGLPSAFAWKGKSYAVTEVLETWKEAGDCRNGSGERYIRKHWFRIGTAQGLEMKLYFERQARSSGGSRWRLYSVRETHAAAPSGEARVAAAAAAAKPVDNSSVVDSRRQP
jgi:hypothetical protein